MGLACPRANKDDSNAYTAYVDLHNDHMYIGGFRGTIKDGYVYGYAIAVGV